MVPSRKMCFEEREKLISCVGEGEPKFLSCNADGLEFTGYEECAMAKLCNVQDLK
jgi:hypothetical protein